MPRAELPDSARCVIVGGGVGGTSLAYHLAELGWGAVGGQIEFGGLVAKVGHVDDGCCKVIAMDPIGPVRIGGNLGGAGGHQVDEPGAPRAVDPRSPQDSDRQSAAGERCLGASQDLCGIAGSVDRCLLGNPFAVIAAHHGGGGDIDQPAKVRRLLAQPGAEFLGDLQVAALITVHIAGRRHRSQHNDFRRGIDVRPAGRIQQVYIVPVESLGKLAAVAAPPGNLV